MSFECFSFGLDVYDEIKILIDQYSTVSIQLEGKEGTGFGWYLENKEELLKANIKPLNLNKHLSAAFIKAKEEDKSLGLNGYFDFHFKLLPGAENSEFKFVYKRFNATENERKMAILIEVTALKIQNSIKFDKNSTSGEFEIKEEEFNSILIDGNATTGYLWFIDNVDELNKYGIELINLGVHNNGEYLTQKPIEGESLLVGAPGVFKFVFKLDNYPKGDLPKIKLVNKRISDKEGKNLIITLKKSPKNSIRFAMNGGKADLEVEKNSKFSVELEGNPTTGYSWILEDAETIKNSTILAAYNLNEDNNSTKTYIPDPCEDGMCGAGGMFIFKFFLRDINDSTELPKLNFGYKRPWEKDVKEYKKAEINLKLKKSEEKILCLKQEGGNAELKVENNKEFEIALEGNPTTGYSWFLKNVEEIKKFGLIQLLNLEENGTAEYVKKGNKKGLLGVGGVFCFRFKVNNSERKDMPKLCFEYKRPWEKEKPAISNAEVTLKL